MKKFLGFMEGLPIWAKIVFAIPFLDVVWVVYRLLKSIDKGNVLGIVLAIVLIVVGVPFLWLADILCIIFMKKVWWLD